MPTELSRFFPSQKLQAGWRSLEGRDSAFPVPTGPQSSLCRGESLQTNQSWSSHGCRELPQTCLCASAVSKHTHVPFFAFDQIRQMLRRVSWHALWRMSRIKTSLSCLCQFIANVGRWFINGEMRFSSCFKMMGYFQSSHSLWLDTWFMNVFVKKCIWQVLKTLLANCFYYSSILEGEQQGKIIILQLVLVFFSLVSLLS